MTSQASKTKGTKSDQKSPAFLRLLTVPVSGVASLEERLKIRHVPMDNDLPSTSKGLADVHRKKLRRAGLDPSSVDRPI
jgi:hypothetical protein